MVGPTLPVEVGESGLLGVDPRVHVIDLESLGHAAARDGTGRVEVLERRALGDVGMAAVVDELVDRLEVLPECPEESVEERLQLSPSG